jgi:hypothetical protein
LGETSHLIGSRWEDGWGGSLAERRDVHQRGADGREPAATDRVSQGRRED